MVAPVREEAQRVHGMRTSAGQGLGDAERNPTAADAAVQCQGADAQRRWGTTAKHGRVGHWRLATAANQGRGGGGETMVEKPPIRREPMHCDVTMAWLETALWLRSGPQHALPGAKPATAQQQGITRQ